VKASLRGAWLADEDGFGSRGDYDALRKRVEALDYEMGAFRQALHDRDPAAVSAVYQKLLLGK